MKNASSKYANWMILVTIGIAQRGGSDTKPSVANMLMDTGAMAQAPQSARPSGAGAGGFGQLSVQLTCRLHDSFFYLEQPSCLSHNSTESETEVFRQQNCFGFLSLL